MAANGLLPYRFAGKARSYSSRHAITQDPMLARKRNRPRAVMHPIKVSLESE